MRILEIGFSPWLKNAFPDSVEFIDTRLRWENTRIYQPTKKGKIAAAAALFGQFRRALSLAKNQNYDAVVARALASENAHNPVRFAAMKLLGQALYSLIVYATRDRVPLAVVDMTDHRTIHPRDLRLLKRCDLYFKRELADNRWNSLETILPRGLCLGATTSSFEYRTLIDKLRPISLGIDPATPPSVDPAAKQYDVFYSGTRYHGIPARDDAADLIGEFGRLGLRVFAPQSRLSPEDFRKAINETWLSISPGGVGWECYRHLEIGLFGSCPLLNYPSNFGYMPYVEGETAFYYQNAKTLRALVPKLLADKDALHAVTTRAQKHVLDWHTFPRLADYIRNELSVTRSGQK